MRQPKLVMHLRVPKAFVVREIAVEMRHVHMRLGNLDNLNVSTFKLQLHSENTSRIALMTKTNIYRYNW